MSTKNSREVYSKHVSPPAERVVMFECAGIDQASLFLQKFNDVLVSILQQEKTQKYI